MMDLREITEKQKKQYNSLVTHVMQSFEWGEFRKELGTRVLRYGIFEKGKLTKAFQLTLHKIPYTSQFIGYLPKGSLPDKGLSQALKIIGEKYNCAFIKVEPDVYADKPLYSVHPSFLPSPKPYFTKYNFILDLKPSEEELMQNMHPKTRYNIRLSRKKGVTVEERTDDEAFKIYLKLYFETTERQGYFGHTPLYHKTAWKTLKKANMVRLLIGLYNKKPLSAWMLINFKDTLYYPYGGSSLEHREVMANNLVAWEAIKLGKKLKLKQFDMWGAANTPHPDRSDPFFGFHNFKEGYGGKLVEYLGSFDLIFNSPLYFAVTSIDKLTKLKVFLLKLSGR